MPPWRQRLNRTGLHLQVPASLPLTQMSEEIGRGKKRAQGRLNGRTDQPPGPVKRSANQSPSPPAVDQQAGGPGLQFNSVEPSPPSDLARELFVFPLALRFDSLGAAFLG